VTDIAVHPDRSNSMATPDPTLADAIAVAAERHAEVGA
jgi:hypothetical protein